DAEVEARADDTEEHDRGEVREPRAVEDAAVSEADGNGVQPLLAIDLRVEERVEEVEASHPQRDGAAERPRRPGQASGDRDPGAHRREPVDGPEPEVAEPGEALQV